MKGTAMEKFWWALGCTFAMWACIAAVLGVVSGVIYGLSFLGLTPAGIFVALAILAVSGMIFWKAWTDYPAYH